MMGKTNHTGYLGDSMQKKTSAYIYRVTCDREKEIGLFIYPKNKQACADI